jgi:hypothetical protein
MWLAATDTESKLSEVASTALPIASASAKLLDEVDIVQTKSMRAIVWHASSGVGRQAETLSTEVDRFLAATSAGATRTLAA